MAPFPSLPVSLQVSLAGPDPQSPWVFQRGGCDLFQLHPPLCSPAIQGEFIVFANEAPRSDWSFAFPRTSHRSQPLEGEGMG